MAETAEVGGVVAAGIAEQLRAEIKAEYEQRYEIWKTKDLAALREEQDGKIQEEVQKLFKKWEAEQKPPSLEEIKTLLDQEYTEVQIKIPVPEAEDGQPKEMSFTIRELPQSVERKFYKQFKENVIKKGPEIAAFAQRNMDQPFEKQVTAFLETFDGAFDILAEAVTLIINPFGKKTGITKEWVADHISSNRQYSIILAQVEVNRLRDFFSRIFASGQRAGTMLTPLNYQTLRQLAR
jgi:hypothetical protein